jgi:hypothetical protein
VRVRLALRSIVPLLDCPRVGFGTGRHKLFREYHMFTSNPFALLTQILSPAFMQVYVILMMLAVLAGTLFDLWHKRSAEYFALRRTNAKALAKREVGSAEMAWLAIKTVAVEVLTAGEFCKVQRRLSHLLMFYGLIIYLIATLIMVFGYARSAHTPTALTALWNLGALMVLGGGLWFFLLLRVDVAYDGHPPWHLMRADLFIGSMIMSAALALLWHFAQTLSPRGIVTLILFGLYLAFTTLLFVSVPWSKFAHMFYKPVAAFQRRLEHANGSSSLPEPAQTSNIRG